MITGLHQGLLKLEGALGALFATFLTLAIGPLAMFWVDLEWDGHFPMVHPLAVMALIALVWCVLELPFLWRIWAAVYTGRVPAALYAAGAQRMRLLPVRLLIAGWWLIHFAIGLMIAWEIKKRAGVTDLAFQVIPFFMVLCYCYAANIYLMQGVVALTRRPGIVEGVWRWRGAFDLGLALLAFFPVPMPNL